MSKILKEKVIWIKLLFQISSENWMIECSEEIATKIIMSKNIEIESHLD